MMMLDLAAVSTKPFLKSCEVVSKLRATHSYAMGMETDGALDSLKPLVPFVDRRLRGFL
jgi:hypothetical protein